MKTKKLLSRREFAEYLGVSPDQLKAILAKRPLSPIVGVDGAEWFQVRHIQAWLDQASSPQPSTDRISKPGTKIICADCKYFDRSPFNYDGAEDGLCLRYAPRLVMARRDPEYFPDEDLDIFPCRRQAFQACGDFVPWTEG